MIIMFMRHADAKNDKLTKFGRRQAKLALKEKENIKFSKVYSSNTKRTIKTARYFQLKYKLPAEVLDGLNDRELLSDGEPKNEKEQEWFNNYMNPLYSSTNPEGCKEFLTRNFIEFKRIIDEHIEKNDNVIIVAHSGTLYALMAYVNGIRKNRNINWFRAGHCSKIYFEVLERI